MTTDLADPVAFDWHDATCPEGRGCGARFLHATAGGGAVLPIVERIVANHVARAKASGLREAADDIETDWAPVWGGDRMWFTTGTAVGELVAETLRAMALEVES